MEAKKTITINFFDINGSYEKNELIDDKINYLNLECPIRILEQYINENLINDLKKEEVDQFIIQYKFSYEINKDDFISINCDIIRNLSFSHLRALDSNGYIVFCNLESQTTLELLEKIVNYIRDNCSLNIKTYIIGVFKENIEDDKTYNKMKNFLSDLDFDYEYYEMFLGNKDIAKIITNEYENAENMEEVFEAVFKDIYEGGKGPRFIKDYNKNNGAMDKSMEKCLLF